MSKVERLYHLHNILQQRRTPIARQELMERLECSQATLYRLVNELRDFLGAP
ncbi:MAG: HTH domain-containing protein, partial [Xanthomonadales bacterium]|nr:HTH domain-containing protein [Xanthomonadales bacterium]